jgi:hypothetical protein
MNHSQGHGILDEMLAHKPSPSTWKVSKQFHSWLNRLGATTASGYKTLLDARYIIDPSLPKDGRHVEPADETPSAPEELRAWGPTTERM